MKKLIVILLTILLFVTLIVGFLLLVGVKEKTSNSKLNTEIRVSSYSGTGYASKNSYSPPTTISYSGCSKCRI